MKIINIGELGKLRLERVLVRVDYPVLFLCQNEKGALYIFVEKESDQFHEQWVAVKTDEEMLNKMYRKEVSIQKAFINPDINRYYIVNHSYSDDSYSYTTSKRMPDDVLNDGEDYIPVLDNSDSILSSAKNVTSKTDSPVLDFHLNPYSHKHSIKASLLAFISNKVVSMFNSATFKKKDDLMVEFEPGSFVLRFYSKSLDGLIPENSSYAAFSTIANILSANSVDEISKEIISNPKLIKPSKELINKLSKEKEDFDLFVTNISDEIKPYAKRVYIEHLNDINQKLKKYSVKESERIVESGILRSYDSVRKAFKFKIDESGTIVSGAWSKEFEDKKYIVHEKYLATISVLEEKYDDDSINARSKKYYKLVKLEKSNR